MVIRYNMGWYEMLLIDVPLFFAATFSVCNFYMVCQREIHNDWRARIRVPAVPDVDRHRPVDQQHARGVRGAVQQADRVRPDAEVPHRRRRATSGSARSTASRSRCSRSSSSRSASTSRRRCSTRWPTRSTATVPFLVLFQVGFLYTGPAVDRPAVRRRLRRGRRRAAARSRRGHEVEGRGPPSHARHHPSGHRSARRSRRRVATALAPGKTTILKDNISWHFPFPAANTTPWQLEGTIQALARRGFTDQVCVQNKTVVTNAFKGEDLNHYVPIFKQYQVPVLYNFKDDGHEVGAVRAEGADARARPHLSGRHPHPRLLLRQEHRPPADDEVPHLHDDDRRDEERVRRPAEHAAALHAFVDSRDAGRSARDPEGNPLRASSRSWTARRPATGRARGRCTRS